MQKGNIGVTTENIFPIIKNSYIATTKYFFVNWFRMQSMQHKN